MTAVPGNATGRSWTNRASVAARGAAWAVLGWMGAAALGLDNILGIGGSDLIAPMALGGAVVGWLGAIRWLERGAIAVVAGLLLVSFAPMRGTIRGLVREDPLSGEADAVLVLAGSLSADGRIGPQAVDRLLEGIRLIRQGAARRLVVSRLAIPRGADTVTSDRDVEYLLEAAALEVEHYTLDPVGTTRLEAERLRELAASRAWRRIVVVTSPLHSRRACAAVERMGFEVACRPSPDRTVALGSLPRPRDRIRAAAGWLYESLAWAQYRRRGWV